jgi:hypothetical protein
MLDNDKRGGASVDSEILSAKSSQGEWIRATSAARVQEAPLRTLDLPQGALRLVVCTISLRSGSPDVRRGVPRQDADLRDAPQL